MDTATVYVQTENKTELNVLNVPKIAVPVTTYKLNTENARHLKRFKLAHSNITDGHFEISL